MEKQLGNGKKRLINIIVLIAIIILLFSAGVIVKNYYDIKQEEKMKQSIEKYKKDAYLFNFEVLSSLADIEKVGNDINSYWFDYIYEDKYSSVNDAVGKALEKNEELIDKIDSEKEKIEEYYEFLQKVPDVNNKELSEIYKAINDLYSDYCKFYNVVINPTGNYQSFHYDFTQLDSSGVKKYRYLNSLLGY